MTVRLIVFTLAALSLVNAYSFVRLYSSTYVTSHLPLASELTDRLPAAIAPGQITIPTQPLKSHIAYDLNCGTGKKMTAQKINGSWVQLKGRLCNNEKMKIVEITNLKNGFTASIFNMGTRQYQTDMIQLSQGDNEIRVRITPVKGDVEEQTLVVVGQSI